MATPIGAIDGKPVFGPPRPPHMEGPRQPISEADEMGWIPEDLPHHVSNFFVPLNKRPACLTCPATANGWDADHLNHRQPTQKDPWSGTSDCGLLGMLPGEIRNEIYKYLLVPRYIEKNLRNLELLEAAECPTQEFVRQNVVDLIRETVMIYPGHTNSGSNKISTSLLLANKQLHVEASQVLFSRNVFAIMIDGAQPTEFWNCRAPSCQTPTFPCLVPLRRVAYIKHLSIILVTGAPPWCVSAKREVSGVKAHLAMVIKALLSANIQLKTLEVRFISTFCGAMGPLLSSPNDATHDVLQTSTIVTAAGDPVLLARTANNTIFFDTVFGRFRLKHGRVLDSLLKLQGRVDYLKIRGDLPKTYIDNIKAKVMQGATPSKIAQRLEEREARLSADRRKYLDGILKNCLEQQKSEGYDSN